MSDRKLVQANQTFSLTVRGVPTQINRGDLFYSDDAVVKMASPCFSDVQVRHTGSERLEREPVLLGVSSTNAVETAVATPGIKRSIGRPKKTEPETSEV